MKIPYAFLGVHGLARAAVGSLPPLIAILITQSLSLQALAACMVASTAVQLLLTPLLAPTVDRTNPLLLLLKCEIVFALLSMVTSWQLLVGHIGLLYWGTFFVGSAVIQAVVGTAYPKISLRLVAHDKLTDFIGWESMVLYSARFAGPIIAGLCLLTWTADKALIGVLMLPPLLAVPLYAWINWRLSDLFDLDDARPIVQPTSIKGRFETWTKNVMGGFKMRWAIETERYLSIQVCLELALVIPTFGILLPRVLMDMQWNNSWLGWLEAGSGAGLMLGSVLAPKTIKQFGQWRTGIGSAFLLALAVGLCGIFITQRQPYLLTTSLFLANFFLALRIQSGSAQRRVAVPDRLRAQFVGAHMTLNALAAQVGVVAAVTWLSHFSAASWFGLSAAAMLLLAFSLMTIPGYRSLVSMEVSKAAGYYERQYPRVFEQLEVSHA
jgi:MFS family permease